MSQSEREDNYYLMTAARCTFRQRILGWVISRISRAMNNGQKEHGGDFWNKATMPHLGSELVDSINYYYTLLHRMHYWRDRLRAALAGNAKHVEVMSEIHAALNWELGPENSDEVYEDELPNSGSIL